MPVYFKGVLASRLIVLILSIVIPIYFSLLLVFSDIYTLSLIIFPNLYFNLIFNFIVTPIILSSPWIVLIYIFRNRLANTFTLWVDKTSIVPLRWLIFYGINTAIIAAFFIFPFISPGLSIFSAIILAWQFIASREGLWIRGRRFLILFSLPVFIAVLALPVIIFLLFYPAYVPLSLWVFTNWQNFVGVFYAFSIWVVNAITIGSSIWVFYNIALRRRIRDVFSESNWIIRGIEILLFILFAYLWIPQLGNMQNVIGYINLVSLGLMAILILIKLKAGAAGGNYSLLGVVVSGGFLVIDLLYRFDIIILTGAFAFTSIIFIASFTYAFLRSDDEMYI